MKYAFLSFAAAALAAGLGQAAPFEAKNVAADAKWVVHVDVDAVRDSQVVKKAFANCPILKESGKHFDALREKIGIDLRKDLHGVTLYGPDSDKKHAVAIVFSTVDKKLLLDKAEHAADHKVTEHGSYEIHSWTAKRHDKSEPGAGAFYKDNVLVFAATPDRVGAAIDVLDGKSPGITDEKSPLGGHVYKGSTVIARAIEIPESVNCAILKQTKSFRAAIGEHDGKSFYRARLVMKSDDAAEQIKTIAEGFKAMGQLRFANDADAAKLIDGFKATVRDNQVRIRWEASADDVWNVLEKLSKKAGEHMKKMKAEGKCPFCGKADGKCPFCSGKGKAKANGESKGATKCNCTDCACPKCKAGEPCDCAACPDCSKAKKE